METEVAGTSAAIAGRKLAMSIRAQARSLRVGLGFAVRLVQITLDAPKDLVGCSEASLRMTRAQHGVHSTKFGRAARRWNVGQRRERQVDNAQRLGASDVLLNPIHHDAPL